MRLSAPTRKTFLLALALIALGVLLWLTSTEGDGTADLGFWLTAGGGGLLVLGSLFNRI